ncbi:uncharacterized protein ELE39_001744 [Cryptosporidium sp. chipmunk genotype I]|uniref:uncharacterized protein n=1 Tax=Cryptosporidium sp. chipmunk genotype I TaxID=1280935 RepID=UPI00351A1D77|nr:hypothetical protein ELE39_001744 [Cryptosporidium sp. chipmunk genotype I]
MHKKIDLFLKIKNFPFNGCIISYQEIFFTILVTTVLISFGIISILRDIEILPNAKDVTIEIQNQESVSNINSLNEISAQNLICKFINSFNEIIYDDYDSSFAQKFHERFLKLLSESFPLNSIDISHQFLFLIYKRILVSKGKDLNIWNLQEFSEVLLHKLKIPKYTLVKCYSEIIKLDNSVLSKEQKNFFTNEKNRLQTIMDGERTIVLQSTKLNILRAVENIKIALRVVILLS